MPEDFYSLAEAMRRLAHRRLYELIEEMERHYAEMERLLDERVRMVSEGFVEPLMSVVDRGDHYLIIIEAPGTKGELDVRISRRSIEVNGYLDESFAREAFGDTLWARRIRRIHGMYTLPEEVEPEKARVERRGKMIIIVAPKKGYS